MRRSFFWAISLCVLLIVYVLFGLVISLLVLFIAVLPFLFFNGAFGIDTSPQKHAQVTSTRAIATNIFEQAHYQSLTLHDLLQLTPPEFEEFIAIFAAAMGKEYWQVQRVGGSGDIGIDVYAKNVYDMPVVFQCKLYSPGNVVDSPMIQQFLGSITYYGAVYGWFITTSGYTKDARRVAAATGRIHLLDGPSLLAYIETRRSEIYAAWRQKQMGIADL